MSFCQEISGQQMLIFWHFQCHSYSKNENYVKCEYF